MRLLACLLLAAATVRAGDLPYPAGKSEHTISGLKTALHLPEGLSADKPASLIVLLHGSGDSGSNLIHVLSKYADAGYVGCAPTASDPRSWSAADAKNVLKIAAHLKEVLPIDPKRVHTMGFSAGGWALEWIAFDEELQPCSATWIAAGARSAGVGRWARKKLGVLALAGSDDPNARAARQTVPMLQDKVRSAECKLQTGLGHKWPKEYDDYLFWWVGVQEGRFTPGHDLNFKWTEELDEARKAVRGQKKGGILVYFWDKADQDNAEARKLQNEVMMDKKVRYYGGQLRCVKLEKDIYSDEASALGVKETPTLVILDKSGAIKKTLTGKFKARGLASSLKKVAPNKKLPK